MRSNSPAAAVPFVLLIALLLATDRVLAQAPASAFATTLTRQGYTYVKMRRSANNSVVTVKMNGRMIDLIVDTGAGRTVIHPEVVQGLKIPLRNSGETTYGALDRVKGRQQREGEAAEFNVGGFDAGPTPIYVLNIGERTSSRDSTDGLLGISFLHRFNAIIDCLHSGLYLKRAPGTFRGFAQGMKSGGYTEIPLRATSNGIAVAATLGNRRGYFIVDTGSPTTLLDTKAVAGLKYPRSVAGGVSLMDIGGTSVELMQVTINDLRIGGFPIPAQAVGLADLELMRGGMPSSDGLQFFGLLGQELLAFYVGVIDCSELKMYLRYDARLDARRQQGR